MFAKPFWKFRDTAVYRKIMPFGLTSRRIFGSIDSVMLSRPGRRRCRCTYIQGSACCS